MGTEDTANYGDVVYETKTFEVTVADYEVMIGDCFFYDSYTVRNKDTGVIEYVHPSLLTVCTYAAQMQQALDTRQFEWGLDASAKEASPEDLLAQLFAERASNESNDDTTE
jgi:predicted RNase H-related nuclease YkuK (DUF458 family)